MGCLYIVCCCNIYNRCCHSMKHHSVTNTHVLRLLEMLRETFIFCFTLFMHKSALIPFLTKHSFKTLHQKLMLSTHKWLWSSKFPDMLEKSCNFDINSVKILLHTLNVRSFFMHFWKFKIFSFVMIYKVQFSVHSCPVWNGWKPDIRANLWKPMESVCSSYLTFHKNWYYRLSLQHLPLHSAIAEAFAKWNLYLFCVSAITEAKLS